MSSLGLVRTAIPAILMMVSISVYSLFDGFFVSNFAGKTGFAAVNLIWPFAMVLGSLGFMMGTGGAALVAKRFGEGKMEEGNKAFSNCFFFSVILGLVCSLSTVFFLPQIARALGSDEEMLPYCVDYGRILILGVTLFNIQNLFQSFFQTAEKQRLGFFVTLAAGVTNIVLDAILVAGCKLGVVGAAIGTIIGQGVGAIVPIFYFALPNSSPLRLKLHKFRFPSIGRMASNGVSEFVSGISSSAVSILLNVKLMRYYGQNGVGAYGIICYVWLIFTAVFIGLNVAIAPRVSYALGANNKTELRSLYGKSLNLLLIFGISQMTLSLALTTPIAYAFASYDQALFDLTRTANRIYSVVYLFLGFNMFGSAFFTALNNGAISMALSAARLGVIEVLCVLFFPELVGPEGIWWSVVLAEGLGTIMNLLVMHGFGRKYGYRLSKEAKRE